MMRYPTEKEKIMNNIEEEISEYIIYDMYHDLSTSIIKENAPKQIKEKFDLWQKLFKEQEMADSIFR